MMFLLYVFLKFTKFHMANYTNYCKRDNFYFFRSHVTKHIILWNTTVPVLLAQEVFKMLGYLSICEQRFNLKHDMSVQDYKKFIFIGMVQPAGKGWLEFIAIIDLSNIRSVCQSYTNKAD